MDIKIQSNYKNLFKQLDGDYENKKVFSGGKSTLKIFTGVNKRILYMRLIIFLIYP